MIIDFQKKEQEQIPIENNAVDPYWFFENEISEDLCNKIIYLSQDHWFPAQVSNNLNDKERLDPRTRITDVCWCNEKWVFDLAWDYLETANRNSNWNFQIDSVEAMQIAKYDINGHFEYHQDGNGFTRHSNNNKYTHNKTRKLSMSIILNDDFEGGEFEFFEKGVVKSKRGTIIVFPSYMLHRVRPVTKGTRYSLVAWFNGNPFR